MPCHATRQLSNAGGLLLLPYCSVAGLGWFCPNIHAVSYHYQPTDVLTQGAIAPAHKGGAAWGSRLRMRQGHSLQLAAARSTSANWHCSAMLPAAPHPRAAM